MGNPREAWAFLDNSDLIAGSDEVASAMGTAQEARLPVRVVDPADHPQIGFPEDTAVLLEPRAGVLLADRVLRAAARWLRRHPRAQIYVAAVDPDLNDRKFIVPGLGDAGDRTFNTL